MYTTFISFEFCYFYYCLNFGRLIVYWYRNIYNNGKVLRNGLWFCSQIEDLYSQNGKAFLKGMRFCSQIEDLYPQNGQVLLNLKAFCFHNLKTCAPWLGLVTKAMVSRSAKPP